MSECVGYKSERNRNAFADRVTRVKGRKRRIWITVDAVEWLDVPDAVVGSGRNTL